MNPQVVDLESRRLDATRHLDQQHRSNFGQFFTPAPVAQFMASLFTPPTGGKSASILDPGAGIGLLSAALLQHLKGNGTATAYELEPSFQAGLRETLARFKGPHVVVARDFIEAAVEEIAKGPEAAQHFDMAILNPPYKKIRTNSHHRALMRKIGVEASNLYACFLACAVTLCKEGAQIAAIIPRSWMNGPYFKPFRYWLLKHAAISHIHIFDSRNITFSDYDVLQESVIIRLVVGEMQGNVKISVSHDQQFADIRHCIVPFSEVVTPCDEELFVHVPIPGSPSTGGLPGKPLREIGLDICTGPVVDFRLKDHLRMAPENGSAPLLYSSHFPNGRIQWPRQSRKPNAIMVNNNTRHWLMPNGCYVVLKRFTSKEEKRRVVAYLLNNGDLQGEWIGFENHLNVIHQNKRGLEPAIARGIAAYLNSQKVDDYFRTFSGHTQVNATDLRRLKYPCLEELRAMGEASSA